MFLPKNEARDELDAWRKDNNKFQLLGFLENLTHNCYANYKAGRWLL